MFGLSLSKILEEDFGITTPEQLLQAYRALLPLDISVFCERPEEAIAPDDEMICSKSDLLAG